MVRVENVSNTPKALANVSRELERSDNHGILIFEEPKTLKGFAAQQTLSGFDARLDLLTQGCCCAPTLGLKLANAFGVTCYYQFPEFRAPDLAGALFQVPCPPKQVKEEAVHHRQTEAPGGSALRHQSIRGRTLRHTRRRD
jgi:hypothetical protein